MIYVKTKDDLVYEYGDNKSTPEYETPVYIDSELGEPVTDYTLRCYCDIPKDTLAEIKAQILIYENVYLTRVLSTKDEIINVPAVLDEEGNVVTESYEITTTVEFWAYTVTFDTLKPTIEVEPTIQDVINEQNKMLFSVADEIIKLKGV